MAHQENSDDARLMQCVRNGNSRGAEQVMHHASPGGRLDALCKSIQLGHDDLVETLLESPIELDTQGSRGEPPLMLAAEEGHLGIVKALLTKGASIDVVQWEVDESYSFTPFLLACAKDHAEIASLLIDQGANRHIVDEQGCNALHWALSNVDAYATALLLIGAGVDTNAADAGGLTPMHGLCFRENPQDPLFGQVVKAMLDAGADPDAKHKGKESAREMARRMGKDTFLSLLEHHELQTRAPGVVGLPRKRF